MNETERLSYRETYRVAVIGHPGKGNYGHALDRAKVEAPMQIRYYPDFGEPRVRLNPGWADFGSGRKGSL